MADLKASLTESPDDPRNSHTKLRWEPVRLNYVGHISEIIRGGGGKLTIAGGDPGEGKKPSGSG
jgi:hypothetical protein